MKLVYYIWALLPGALLFFSIRGAVAKSVSKKPTGRHLGFYLRQSIYAFIVLGAAIVIDAYFFEVWVKALGFAHMDLRVVGWLIYPVLLMIGASIQQHFINKRTAREDAARKQRKVEYMYR